jgi:hypothetical protein
VPCGAHNEETQVNYERELAQVRGSDIDGIRADGAAIYRMIEAHLDSLTVLPCAWQRQTVCRIGTAASRIVTPFKKQGRPVTT